MMFRNRVLEWPRWSKLVILMVLDYLSLCLAVWLSFVIRLGGESDLGSLDSNPWLYAIAPILTLSCLLGFGIYSHLLRFFDTQALLVIVKSITLASLILALLIFLNRPGELIPRSVVVIFWSLACLLVAGSRLLLKHYLLHGAIENPFLLKFKKKNQVKGQPRVLIYGAGSAGNQLASALKSAHKMIPVGFIDDDQRLNGRRIYGLKIYSGLGIKKAVKRTGATEILIAIPTLNPIRKKEILNHLESLSVHVRSVPGLQDLASGHVTVEDLREVDIGDLLGRQPVSPMHDLLKACVANKVVMVSGAGGSIGSELCRQILSLNPKVLILFDHSEFNLYQIQRELIGKLPYHPAVQIHAVLGSVCHQARVEDVLQLYGVQTIYHAAAYKHVPLVEHNAIEGINNNVFGTYALAQAAIKAKVENFVAISTDKAVRPTNIMGCSKRLSEMILQSLSSQRNSNMDTRFVMVRFGNVLGSSGSVIPLFREQIRHGGPVTVTHPEVTRFFMTIPEAAQLVIQAGAMGYGGDVFVLEMGQPVPIIDLAEKMIHLSGLSVCSESNPEGDIEILITGLRPGEKMHEELWLGDVIKPTEHPMIMRAEDHAWPWSDLDDLLKELSNAMQAKNILGMMRLLKTAVPEFSPNGPLASADLSDLTPTHSKEVLS